MLVSKLRVVFESASGEVELWHKTASADVVSQLGERRRAFRRRYEALERIQLASGELEQRIAELDAQNARLQQFVVRVGKLTEALCDHAPPQPELQEPRPTDAVGMASRMQAHA